MVAASAIPRSLVPGRGSRVEALAQPQIVVEPDGGRLFLSREGGPIAPATPTGPVSEYVLASGVGKGGACHIFRNSVATLMLEGGADVRFNRRCWATPDDAIDTRVSIQRLKAIHHATHPVAKLKPAAARPAEVKTEAGRAALLEALDAEADEDQARRGLA